MPPARTYGLAVQSHRGAPACVLIVADAPVQAPTQTLVVCMLLQAEIDFAMLIQKVWGTNLKVDLIMKLLGLFHCRDTFVGDAMTRGIRCAAQQRSQATGTMRA